MRSVTRAALEPASMFYQAAKRGGGGMLNLFLLKIERRSASGEISRARETIIRYRGYLLHHLERLSIIASIGIFISIASCIIYIAYHAEATDRQHFDGLKLCIAIWCPYY